MDKAVAERSDGGVMWWVQCEQKRAVSRTKLDVDAEPSASAE